MPLEPPFYNPLFSDGPPPASSPVVVLSCAPMLDIVVQYLSPGDVARLQCTCRAIYEALIIWKRAAYNVNRFLGRFFKDPVAFRILQAQTNLLISGSFPLQFMDRIYYKDSDLDPYVSSSRTREVVIFLRTQNYEFIPRDRAGSLTDPSLEIFLTKLEQEKRELYNKEVSLGHYSERGDGVHYNDSCIHGVLCFRHRENTTLVVQIIAIYSSIPPICSIMLFHSTVVLNFMTWNKSVSLYPYATFEQRRSLVLRKNNRFPVAKEKYLARGFTFQDLLTPEEARSPGSFQVGPRYVGDQRTWILNLETESIPSTSIPASRRVYDPEMIYSWDLTNIKYSDQLRRDPPFNILNGEIAKTRHQHNPLIYFSLLKNNSLKHMYVVHREFHRLATEVYLGPAGRDVHATDPPPTAGVKLPKLDGKLAECLTSFAEWVNEVRSKIEANPNHDYCWWRL